MVYSNRGVMALSAAIIFMLWKILACFSAFTPHSMTPPIALYPASWAISPLLHDPRLTTSKPFWLSPLASTSSLMLTNLATPILQVLIPLYIYPDASWDEVAAAANQVPITAIINPNSGPGTGGPDLPYQQGLNKLRAACVTILGYVYTSYGSRPLPEVKADIDQYDLYFNLHGIFLDEVASSPDELSYYADLYKYVKSKADSYQVVLNPGTQIDESYISLSQPAGDMVVIFEGSSNDPSNDWQHYLPSPYVPNYPRDHFAAIIHTSPSSATMRSDIDLAVARHIGYVYVTDDIMDNPYNLLPTYWQDEISYIKLLNGQARSSRFCFYLPLILKNS